jgi:hypothetical protein
VPPRGDINLVDANNRSGGGREFSQLSRDTVFFVWIAHLAVGKIPQFGRCVGDMRERRETFPLPTIRCLVRRRTRDLRRQPAQPPFISSLRLQRIAI